MNLQTFSEAFNIISNLPTEEQNRLEITTSLIRTLDHDLNKSDLEDLWYVADRVEVWVDWQDKDFTSIQIVDLAIQYVTLKKS